MLKNHISKFFPDPTNVNITDYWQENVVFNLNFGLTYFQKMVSIMLQVFCESEVIWAWWIGQKVHLKILGGKQEKPHSISAPNNNTFF